ncbi:MAG: xanthine dehydrogenase FAD-binding subunit XdhB [Eubacteriales bacterium]|nr:xanthine dehydrogenase FAD-binding subunit XdhB [Eubacteriales bacterium]
MYDIGAYYNAKTIEEAVSLLEQHPKARIICGGSDMLVKIREGRMAGTDLVCIREIPQLYGVTMNDQGEILVGAATTFSHLAADGLIRRHVPVLGEAVDQVGGPQVRNIGTIGGNVCNGAVSADSAPALFSLNAILETASPQGNRRIPIGEFYEGPGRVRLSQGEVLTRLVIPREGYEGCSGHYIKYAMRDAMDIATLSCCAVCRVEDGILSEVRITFGVAAPVPLRLTRTEEALRGKPVSEELYDQVRDLVRQEITPRDSWRASRAFRLQVGGEIAARALKEAVEKAGGERA